MSHIQRIPVTITVDASGDGTGYVEAGPGGNVLALQYVKVDYANGVDFVVTSQLTGMAILTVANVNASATFYPRAQVHDTADGTVMTLDGTRKATAPVPIGAGDSVKIVVAAGGNATSGTFHVLLG